MIWVWVKKMVAVATNAQAKNVAVAEHEHEREQLEQLLEERAPQARDVFNETLQAMRERYK